MSYNEEFQRRLTEKRRLAVLCFLVEEPDLRMGVELMQMALESYLININSDDLLQDIDYLRQAGLLTLEHIGSLPAIRLTSAGREVARGTRRVSGIQRPPLD